MKPFARVGLATAVLSLMIAIPGLAEADPSTPPPAAPATQTQAIEVSVAAPESSTGPAYVTVTGLKNGQWITVFVGQDTAMDRQQQGTGPLRVRLDAPTVGWPVRVQQVARIELPDGANRRVSFTYDGRGDADDESPRVPQAGQSIKVTKPATATSPVTVTITGLKKGNEVRVRGWETNKQGAPDYGFTMIQKGTGDVTYPVSPPAGGWKPGAEYAFQVVFADGGVDTARFTAPTAHASGPAQPTKPSEGAPKTKDPRGGLAKTGV